MRKTSLPVLSRAGKIERQIILKSGLAEFVRRTWPLVEPGTVYKHNWHVDVICKELEDITFGRNRWLVINIPPGGMKSLLVSVFWPCWEWAAVRASTKWSFWSFDEGLTKRDAGRSLKILRSDWWLERFGTSCLVPGDPSEKEFENLQGGWRFASSVDGKGTGRHPDRRVIDDPLKPLEATKTNLEHVLEWRKGTISSRGDPTTVTEVLIMQRLHEMDLSEFLVEQGYRHVRLPMRYEAKFPCFADPRRVDGELFWHERFPETEVARLERELGPTPFAAQYQQRPVPEGGAIFEKGCAGRYKALPTLRGTWCISVDCTFKDTDGTDYVSIGVWAFYCGKFYLIDRVSDRMGFSATVEAIRIVRRKWPQARAILIEDKANGSAVIETLKKEIAGVEAIEPEGGKTARANAISGFWKVGDILFPETDWADSVISQAHAFPMGAHDDDVDMMSQAVNWLYLRANKLREAMEHAKEMMKNGENPLGLIEIPEDFY